MVREDISEQDFIQQIKKESNQILIVEALVDHALEKKSRRNRQRFSKAVLNLLAEELEKNRVWDKAQRKRLVEQTGMNKQ